MVTKLLPFFDFLQKKGIGLGIANNGTVVGVDHPVPGDDEIQGAGLVPFLFEAVGYRLITSHFHPHCQGICLQPRHAHIARGDTVDVGIQNQIHYWAHGSCGFFFHGIPLCVGDEFRRQNAKKVDFRTWWIGYYVNNLLLACDEGGTGAETDR